MKRIPQRQIVLNVLRSVQRRQHNIPEEYIRHHNTGDGVSARYFKQVLFISEVNGRISELRSNGQVIETSLERDDHGFAFHRLQPVSVREQHLRDAKAACEAFDRYHPTV
jgi:hypothetical protein